MISYNQWGLKSGTLKISRLLGDSGGQKESESLLFKGQIALGTYSIEAAV